MDIQQDLVTRKQSAAPSDSAAPSPSGLPRISIDRAEVLRRTAAHIVKEDKTIILVTLTGHYIDFLHNWIVSVERFGHSSKVLMIAEDKAAHSFLSARWPNQTLFLHSGEEVGVPESDGKNFGSDFFNRVVERRQSYVLTLLEMGMSVLLSDIDMVWVKDPMLYLHEHAQAYDILFQEDGTVVDDMQKRFPQGKPGIPILDGQPHQLCVCFMFARPTEGAKSLVRLWQRELEKLNQGKRHAAVDRDVLIHLLRSADGTQFKVGILPVLQFPSGCIYFGGNPHCDQAREEYLQALAAGKADVVVVHINWRFGHEKKVQKLKDHGLWLQLESGVVQDAPGTLGRVSSLELELNSAFNLNNSLPPSGQLLLRGASVPRQGSFTNFPDVGFVFYRTHRLGPTTFAVLTLLWTATWEYPAPGSLPPVSCTWEDAKTGTRWTGAVTLPKCLHSKGTPYLPYVIFCDISPAPESCSGNLTAANNTEIEWACSGTLNFSVGPHEFVAYAQAENITLSSPTSKGPFAHRLSYCSGPIFSHINPVSITQWLTYHVHGVGFGMLRLYNAGGVTDNIIAEHWGPFVASSVLQVIDWQGQEAYPSWYHAQELSILDCVYANHEKASWLALWDLDEYLDVVLPPPTTLPAFLDEQQARDVVYISLGTYMYPSQCNDTQSLWDSADTKFAVEKLLYRKPNPFCEVAENDPGLCSDYKGHRKLILNPRKVRLLNAHKVHAFVGGGTSLYLHVVRDMRLGHFRGITSAQYHCSPSDEELILSTSIADLAAISREHRASQLSNV